MSKNLAPWLARTVIAVLALTSAVVCYGVSDLRYIEVTALGAKNDAVQLKGCSTVAGSTALACNGPFGKGFSAASVSKTIVVRGAGVPLAPYSPLITTIAAYVDANHVTLATAAVQTVRGTASALFGTDNAAAFCAATQCTQAVYTGLYANGPLTGRELYIPGGSYLTTQPLYCRAGMTCIGAGRADTQIELATVQNNLTQTVSSLNWNTTSITPVICLGNATAGSGTCTPDNVDAGATGPSAVYDMLEDSFGSITAGVLATSVTQTNGGNPYPSSAFYLHNLWPETRYGIVSWQTSIGDISGFQGDFGTFGIMLYGAGIASGASQPWGWNIHDSQLDSIQTPIYIDGMGDVLISNNTCGYTTATCVYVNSASGKTAYRISIKGNMFTDSGLYHGPNGGYVSFDGLCVDCSVLNNTFAYSSTNDILFTANASGLTGMLIDGNVFTSGQHDSGASIQAISTTSGEVTISNNDWDTPGYYAVFLANMSVKLDNNTCLNPFAVNAPPADNAYQSGCFFFTGSVASAVEASNNSVTSSGSTKYPAVNVYGPSAIISGSSSGNKSDYSGCAVCDYSTHSGVRTSFNEVAANYGPSGTRLYAPSVGTGGFQDGVNGAASSLACYKADGKTLGHCTAYTGGTTCTCGP